MVHRDLKPECVVGARDAGGGLSVMIVDGGLARFQASGVTSSADHAALVASCAYLAPEQILGEEVDCRCDVFATGVMLVEMLTGHRPFHGTTVQQVTRAVLHDAYHLPGDTEELMSLDAALQRCLAKSRHDRWDSVTSVRRELVPRLRACGQAALHTSIHTTIATIPPATQSIQ